MSFFQTRYGVLLKEDTVRCASTEGYGLFTTFFIISFKFKEEKKKYK